MAAELAVCSGFEQFLPDDLREIDGEWRLSHVVLARIAKMSQPLVAARLVGRHWDWLNRISRVATVATRPESGGQEWTEYFLTRAHRIDLLATATNQPFAAVAAGRGVDIEQALNPRQNDARAMKHHGPNPHYGPRKKKVP